MKWLTKQLTLDLLAITIDGLIRASERISLEPDPVNGDWPPATPSKPKEPAEEKTPEPAPALVDKKLTREDVRKVLVKISNDPDHGKPAVKKILNAVGAPKFKDVPEEKFTEVLELAKKEMAA